MRRKISTEALGTVKSATTKAAPTHRRERRREIEQKLAKVTKLIYCTSDWLAASENVPIFVSFVAFCVILFFFIPQPKG